FCVPQRKLLQVCTPFSPWQVGGSSHTGICVPNPGQSEASWQQSPASQQKPFWQWSLLQSEVSLQISPLARSAKQVPASQCAVGMHLVSSSPSHMVAQWSPFSPPSEQV